MFIYRKIWRALFSCNTHFEVRPFALFTDDSLSNILYTPCNIQKTLKTIKRQKCNFEH